MDRYYPTAYREYRTVARAPLRALYRHRAKTWTRSFARKGLALEIGCGAGWMLRALRSQGWRVVGVERTVSAVRAATSGDHVPVFVGELDAIRSEPRFDLVLLFHVLEHLSDPLAVLRRCFEILRPGGRLIVAVPNFESWQARLFRGAWFHLDVPRHLMHFSPRSITRLLETVGVKVEAVRYASWGHDPYGWVQSLLNQLGFRQNLLTRWLMGLDLGMLANARGLAMLLGAAVLFVPCLGLAIASWLARSGAIMEVCASKP